MFFIYTIGRIKVGCLPVTNGDGAWADTTAKEKQIVAAMKNGTKLSVTGTSWKGTETTDNYSLSGITAAMDKIDSACK